MSKATSTFARLDEDNVIIELFEHTDDERDEYIRTAPDGGRSYVYLPLGGEIGDEVEVDDDGEAVVRS